MRLPFVQETNLKGFLSISFDYYPFSSTISLLKLIIPVNLLILPVFHSSNSSHTAAHKTTEKANSHEGVTVNEEASISNDIQGSEENRSHEQYCHIVF